MESGMTFHDVNGPKIEVTVKSIEEQGEWESRKLWGKVSKGIREADFESASKEKGRIEVCDDLGHDGKKRLRLNFVLPRTSRDRGGEMNRLLEPLGS
jgi:hypothetical protein